MAINQGWIVWLGFREASNYLTDNSGNGNNLTNPNNALFEPSGGKPGGYLHYPNTSLTSGSQIINTGTNLNISAGTGMSVCAWVFPSYSGALSRVLIQKRIAVSTTDNEFLFEITGTTNPRFTVASGGNSANSISLTHAVGNTLNVWTHFVWSVDYPTKTITAYKNGVPLAIATVETGTFVAPTNGTAPIMVGATTTYVGRTVMYVDGIGVRNTTTNASEVTLLYNAGNGFNPFTTGAAMMNFF